MALTQQQIANLCAKRPVRAVEGGKIMTGPVRLSFPSLHEKSAVAGSKPKYNAIGIFPHANVGVLYQALVAAVKQGYPNVTDPTVLLDKYNKNHPLKDGALRINVADGGKEPVKATRSGFTLGLPYIHPKSGMSVPCFHAAQGTWKSVAVPSEIQELFYAGCWVEMKIGIGKSTAAANPGVSLYLDGVWKLADDDKLGGGGGSASADEGGSADDAVSIEDPNAALGASGGGWGGNTAQPEASAWD